MNGEPLTEDELRTARLTLAAARARRAPVDTDEPLTAARRFLVEEHDHPEGRLLYHWRGDFYTWRGSYFSIVPPDAVRAGLYAWIDARDGKPTKRAVDNVLDALKAAAHLDAVPPCWLNGTPADGELIACANGLVHVATRELLAPTPAYFNLNACAFDYQPEASRPAAWLGFLGSLWREDHDSVTALQEIFGLLLTADTSHQKIILLIGPKRSGKGTIARVLRGLIGADNTTAPTLTGIGQNFGLAGLIGKPLAVISDARLSGRSDLAAVVENMLRVSGEDSVSVPRKFQPDWVGQLPTRFVMLTNELPALTDASGALASRFVILPMTRSFYGREDTALTAKLLAELPGIFAWALDGLDRLRARGHLLQPAPGAAMLEQLDRLASPIKAFVADCCTLEPGAEIGCGDLFAAWANWCQSQHRDHAGTVAMLGRNLHAAFPTTATRHARRGGDRLRVFSGIRLRRPDDPTPEESADGTAGTRWHACRPISSPTASPPRVQSKKERVPSRATPEDDTAGDDLKHGIDAADRIDAAARQAGISAETLAAHLTADDLGDPGLDLAAYARGIARDVAPRHAAATGGVP